MARGAAEPERLEQRHVGTAVGVRARYRTRPEVGERRLAVYGWIILCELLTGVVEDPAAPGAHVIREIAHTVLGYQGYGVVDRHATAALGLCRLLRLAI